MKKSTFAPLVAALAATADGKLPRAGKGGSQSIAGAAPVRRSKNPAVQAKIDANGGSLTKSAFCALQVGDGRANGTCRECNRACTRHISLCLKGRGCDAPQTWVQCDACDKGAWCRMGKLVGLQPVCGEGTCSRAR